MKRFFLLLFICLFSSCITSPDTEPLNNLFPLDGINEQYWFTPFQDGKLTIIGISGKQSKPENEIIIARNNAAEKLSMYHNLLIDFQNIQGSGANILDYHNTTYVNVKYDTNIEQYLENLTFNEEKDFFTINRNTVIRFSYPVFPAVKITQETTYDESGKPEWIKTFPIDTDDFCFGVGMAAKQQRFTDTVMKSMINAAASIVSRNASMNTVDANEVVSHMTTTHSSFIHQESKGKLNNFYVLETWIDPNSGAVWTLAIAKNVN
jgi:hypothetical protein